MLAACMVSPADNGSPSHRSQMIQNNSKICEVSPHFPCMDMCNICARDVGTLSAHHKQSPQQWCPKAAPGKVLALQAQD